MRLDWGKDGAGIVAKLGINGCYGKTAQGKGSIDTTINGTKYRVKSPVYQCPVWAGMITAKCRAMLLDGIAAAKDRRNVICLATDGILSLEPLTLAEPLDTGTRELAAKHGKLPLGALEGCKEPLAGVHLVRPGMLFPLDLGASLKETKGRGVGKANLARERERILELYERAPREPFKVKRRVFFGMKSCVRMTDGVATRDEKYGSWAEQEIEVSYSPHPKRPLVRADGTMATWAFSQTLRSTPYASAIVPPHVVALKREREIDDDQPDGQDFMKI